MAHISLSLGTHGTETTVSEMRKRLARTLSKLRGDQIVFFNFTLHYIPAPTVVYGELARPENE